MAHRTKPIEVVRERQGQEGEQRIDALVLAFAHAQALTDGPHAERIVAEQTLNALIDALEPRDVQALSRLGSVSSDPELSGLMRCIARRTMSQVKDRVSALEALPDWTVRDVRKTRDVSPPNDPEPKRPRRRR